MLGLTAVHHVASKGQDVYITPSSMYTANEYIHSFEKIWI